MLNYTWWLKGHWLLREKHLVLHKDRQEQTEIYGLTRISQDQKIVTASTFCNSLKKWITHLILFFLSYLFFFVAENPIMLDAFYDILNPIILVFLV